MSLYKGKRVLPDLQPIRAWNLPNSPLLSTQPHVNPNFSAGQRINRDLSWMNKDLSGKADEREHHSLLE
jgi:hypothetical protein